MRATRFGLLFLLALVAPGCTGEADDSSPMEGGSAPPAVGEASAIQRPAGEMRIEMVGIDGAEVSGTAAFAPREQGSEVTVALEPLPSEGMYQGHIHVGESCGEIGPMRWPLQPVTSSAAAEGRSVTPLAVPVDSIMNGSTLVVFHQQGGQPMICGDIPVLPPNLPA